VYWSGQPHSPLLPVTFGSDLWELSAKNATGVPWCRCGARSILALLSTCPGCNECAGTLLLNSIAAALSIDAQALLTERAFYVNNGIWATD